MVRRGAASITQESGQADGGYHAVTMVATLAMVEA